MSEILGQQPSQLQGLRVKPLRTRIPSLRSILVLWMPTIIVAGMVLLPIFYLVLRAFSADQSAWDQIFRIQTLETVGRTIWLAVAVTLASTAIAVPVAWLTVRSDLPLRRLWTLLTPLPLVIPSYVGAYLMVSTIGPRGLFQSFLESSFGIERIPDIYGFPGAMLILTLMSYPFILLSVRAALQKIDPALEDAARSLGLNAWSTFWRVTFPQIRPAITAGGLLVALYVLRDFGAVSIMRYNTFTRVIYIQYQSSFNRSSAAVLALGLVSIAILILAFEVWTRGQGRYYRSDASASKPAAVIPLGRWRWPALIFCSILVGSALVMPAGVLIFWLLRGLEAGEQISSLWLAAKNSILGSSLASVVTLIAALPVAVLSVRKPNPVSRLLDRLTYIAFALPGIVIALALVFFGANFAPFLYQTLPLLVFAYLILFLPEAVGAVRTSLEQVPPNIEEAGLSLGQKPHQVFQKITLPLIRPGIAAGAGLVFLTTIKELPATLILAPYGFKTLATSVWSAVSEAFFARAAAPALILILISSIPLALLIFRDQNHS